MIYFQPAKDCISEDSNSFSIAWLYPDMSLDNPSNRLRRYQIGDFLAKIPNIRVENFYGYVQDPTILEKLKYFDVIVMFNLGSVEIEICKLFQDKILIFDHCERIFGLGEEDFLMKNVSAITCCSTALAKTTEYYLSQMQVQKNIFVIRDSVDDSLLTINKQIGQQDKVLLIGMGGNIKYTLPTLAPVAEKAGYKIRIISEKEYSFLGHDFIVWDKESWIRYSLECSVALCFHDVNMFPDKGNVKVTTPMALGLPVIASPIESYIEAVTHGYTGYIARNTEEWLNFLLDLKNPTKRNYMGYRARYYARKEYSSEKIGLDYLAMIQKLMQLKRS